MASENKRSFSKFTGSTLMELLRWRALCEPDTIAYTYLLDGEAQEFNLTYKELDIQAQIIAAALQGLRATGERVLLLYPPGLEFTAAFFGCMYAGAVAVPAYPPDPARINRSLPRLHALVEDAGAKVVLTTSQIQASTKRFFRQVRAFEELRWVATDDLPSTAASGWRELMPNRDGLAFLQYTSGSTGKPKGVMLTHRNLLENAAMVYQAVDHKPGDRYVSWLPTFHDMGFMAGVLQPLYGGFQAVLFSPVAFLQRPLLWLQVISRCKATTSGGPNFAYDLCVRKTSTEQRASLDLSTWSVAFNGSETVRSETLDRFVAAFQPAGFRRDAFYPCYGLAEATLIVSGGQRGAPPVTKKVQAKGLAINRALEGLAENAAEPLMVSCGTPLSKQKVVIVNLETSTECLSGEVGEVWVSGPNVAQGYWNHSAETEYAFRAFLDPTGEGPFLRTGDLGFIDNGELFITGRRKDLIIIRGLNHYPQDIELTVEHSHPNLRPGCGAAFSVEVTNEERLVVVQEVIYQEQLDLDSLVETIREAVAEEHQIQVYAIMLIKPGSLPKTSSGKIQRHACRAGFLNNSLDPALQWRANIGPEDEPSFSSRALSDPKAIEGWLVSKIAAKTGLSPSRINVQHPIIRFGFDSLAAIEFMHMIETEFGAILPMVSFLQDQSIADLATQISSRVTPDSSAKGELAHDSTTLAEYPLSHGQRALWFLHQFAPESAAYNIAAAVRIRADLDVGALRRTFQALVDRHSSLRTTFVTRGGEPMQRVHEYMEVRFSQRDATSWSPSVLTRRLAKEAYRPFDLGNSLLRVTVFESSQEEYVLLLVVHHIVADFWSLALLLNEMGILYQSEKRGTRAELPPLTSNYTDYLRWQTKMLASAEGERLWSYWREQLSGDLPVMNLPADRLRPMAQTFRGASQVLKINAETTKGLKQLGRHYETTLYVTLLAAFQALLHRYNGQEDILIGSPTAGRSSAEFAGVVGYFVNPIVIRANFSSPSTFAQFLVRLRQTVLEAFAHQEYPFPLLVERLEPARDASRSPLFDVMFVLQKTSLFEEQGLARFALGEENSRIKLGELKLEPVPLEQRVAQFDLTLFIAESDEGLIASLLYNTELFEASTIQRLLGHFQTVLEAVVANPDQPLARLPLLTQPERQQLLVDWNLTASDYELDLGLHQLFEQQVRRSPEAVALVYEDQFLTYAELNGRANQLAAYLCRQGVGPEVVVGICMQRSLEMVVAILAVLKAGAAYLPLEPDYPRHRLDYMLKDVAAPVVLTQERFTERFAPDGLRVMALDTQWELAAADSAQDPGPRASADNLAYVIYTSGSTGQPKGVMVSHRAAGNLMRWMQQEFGLSAADSLLQKTAYSFDAAVWEFFWPLSNGGRLVLARPAGQQDAQYLIEEIKRQQITVLQVVPSLLQVLVSEPDLRACASLRRVFCGGEMLAVDLVERYRQQLRAELYNVYGPTEAAMHVTVYDSRKLEPHKRSVPIGRPVGNTEIYVLDQGGELVAVGVEAEIYIGGQQLARGYVNQAAGVAEKFIPNGYSQAGGGRLYRTGDMGKYSREGNLEIIGRKDEQVKVRGYRIELGEIEAVIGQQPAVKQCVVLAREDQPGDKRLIAYIVPQQMPADSIWQRVSPKSQEQLPDHEKLYRFPNGMVITHYGEIQTNTKIIYDEIFETESYLKHGITIKDGDCVFDAGAHIGMFTLYVTQKVKHAFVYAFEPIPPLFEILRKNVESNGTNVKLFECGLSNEATSATFTFYPNVPGLSGRFSDPEAVKNERKALIESMANAAMTAQERAAFSEADLNEGIERAFMAESYVCQLRTVSDIIREYNIEQIDLLKIDVERSEYDVLSGIRNEDWKKIKQIVVEVDTKELQDQIASLLASQGFAFIIEESPDGFEGTDVAISMIYAVESSMKEKLINQERKEESTETQPSNGRAVLSVAELKLKVREKLPEYMVPTGFVILKELPLLTNGKVDRRALPAPDSANQQLDRAYHPPRNPVEQKLAAIWAVVLRVEQVGIHDNFFEMGGHSLLATQLISRIKDQMQVELPLRQLFEKPTVAGLAQEIAAKGQEPGEADKLAGMLRRIKQMNEQELRAILSQPKES